VAKLIRLLPLAEADGAHNMAADEALLLSAADGLASLRFYRWSTPTVSLGYFQPAAERERDSLLKDLPFVRRPTGGATLVHHHEVTYALALPPGFIGKESWLVRMHRVICSVLTQLGVPSELVETAGGHSLPQMLCFRQFTPGDVLCRGAKVVGSAQRKARQCLLQHGAVLLERSPFAPLLPGIRELAGVALKPEELSAAIEHAFAQETGCSVVSSEWTGEEVAAIPRLKASRYASAAWNCKR
jgi:lipoate-protein ligase A